MDWSQGRNKKARTQSGDWVRVGVGIPAEKEVWPPERQTQH